MAQRIITALVDGHDGADLGRGVGETTRFGIDGRDYEIDLSDEHAAELREALRPFIDGGRRVVPPCTHARRR